MDQLRQPVLVKKQAARMAVSTTWRLCIYRAAVRNHYISFRVPEDSSYTACPLNKDVVGRFETSGTPS